MISTCARNELCRIDNRGLVSTMSYILPSVKTVAGRPVRGKPSTLPVLLDLRFTAVIVGRAAGDMLK